MRSHRRALIAYLALALLLGGASAAGALANLALQLGGALLLGWSLALYPPAPPDRRFRLFLAALFVLAVVQFLPLPPGRWSAMPGRSAVAGDLAAIGVTAEWRPLSLAPWHGVMALAWAIPAAAVLCAVRVQAGLGRDLPRLLLGVAVPSALLGLVQRVQGTGYLYAVTNRGEAPGFFANANHQASFLLVALVWIGAGWTAARGKRRERTWRRAALAAVPLLVVGILANGSLAVDGLLLILAVGGAASLAAPRLPVVALSAASLLVIGFGFLLATGRLSNDLAGAGMVPGISRHDFLAVGLRMLAAYFPIGSGLGSFPLAYPLFEDAARVGPVFVNHAHDDLLELLVEGGLLGLAALTAFLVWFGPAAHRAWRSGDPHRRAAVLALAVELAHSLVDYPLRTAALSALAAAAVGLLLAPAPARPGGP